MIRYCPTFSGAMIASCGMLIDRTDFVLLCVAALWKAFTRVEASDEWYFSTVCAALGLISLSELYARERALAAAKDRFDLYGTPIPLDIEVASRSDAVHTQASGKHASTVCRCVNACVAVAESMVVARTK